MVVADSAAADSVEEEPAEVSDNSRLPEGADPHLYVRYGEKTSSRDAKGSLG